MGGCGWIVNKLVNVNDPHNPLTLHSPSPDHTQTLSHNRICLWCPWWSLYSEFRTFILFIVFDDVPVWTSSNSVLSVIFVNSINVSRFKTHSLEHHFCMMIHDFLRTFVRYVISDLSVFTFWIHGETRCSLFMNVIFTFMFWKSSGIFWQSIRIFWVNGSICDKNWRSYSRKYNRYDSTCMVLMWQRITKYIRVIGTACPPQLDCPHGVFSFKNFCRHTIGPHHVSGYRASNLQGPGSIAAFSATSNVMCDDQDALEFYMCWSNCCSNTLIYPVRRGFRDYWRVLLGVQQRFQDGLPSEGSDA